VNDRSDSTPFFSVIIPIWNAEATLPACIGSVLSQTFRDFELLLIDDGSTDGSANLCRRYADADPRVRYFRKENGGCYQSRIYGWVRSRGRWVLNCDADDLYHTKKAFQRLHDRLLQVDCDAAQFGTVFQYRHLRRVVRTVRRPVLADAETLCSRDYPKLLYTSWDGSRILNYVHNKVYRRQLIAELPAPEEAEDLFQCEDAMLNLQLLEHCKAFLFLPDPLYRYNRLIGASHSFQRRRTRDMDLVWRCQLRIEARREQGLPDRDPERIYRVIARRLADILTDAGKHLDAADLRALIAESLAMGAMTEARQYYLAHPELSGAGVDLLRQGDPEAYLREIEGAAQRRRLSPRSVLRYICHRL
jgi:glycosyltransferase involved in cell wall biosynthesis